MVKINNKKHYWSITLFKYLHIFISKILYHYIISLFYYRIDIFYNKYLPKKLKIKFYK